MPGKRKAASQEVDEVASFDKIYKGLDESKFTEDQYEQLKEVCDALFEKSKKHKYVTTIENCIKSYYEKTRSEDEDDDEEGKLP